MSSFDDLIASLSTDTLSRVRALHAQGQRVIGYVGADVPVELIFAADAVPVRLVGRAGHSEDLAERYVERSFAPDLRSLAGQWLAGELDFIDAVIFSRTGDSAQRLYYYLCELQRCGAASGPRPLLYDIAKIPREASRAHTLAATRKLANDIGAQSAMLPLAAQRVCKRQALLARLEASRLGDQPLAGSLAHRVARIAAYDWSEHFDELLEGWLGTAPAFDYRRRILLAGSRPTDELLHHAVESASATIVGEWYEEETLAAPLPPERVSIESIATRSHELPCTARAFVDSGRLLVERAQTVRADAVILWLIEEDEAIVWELPGQLRALAEAKLPALALTRQHWQADEETLSRIARFAETAEVSQ